LQATVNKFNGEPTDALPVLNTATSILNTIKDGTVKVAAAQSLGLFETIGILGPLGSLSSAVGTTIDGLLAKKKDF
jgi:hydrophobic surface binding protein A